MRVPSNPDGVVALPISLDHTPATVPWRCCLWTKSYSQPQVFPNRVNLARDQCDRSFKASPLSTISPRPKTERKNTLTTTQTDVDTINCAECGDPTTNTDSLLCDDCTPHCTECGIDTTQLNELDQCQDCQILCGSCDEPVSEMYDVDGWMTWCEACYEEHSGYCDGCENRRRFEDMYGCTDCGNWFCISDCYSDHLGEHSGIHDYAYKPRPIFHGNISQRSGTRYFGVELEIDDGNDQNSTAESLLELSNDENLFYLKTDGSLTEDGIEIVTHPATLAYHLNKFPWARITKTASDSGYLSHSAEGSCGMHVHVSRDSLGNTFSRQDATISKLIIMLFNHWQEFWKFSRRQSGDVRWCPQQYTAERISKTGLDDAKKQGKYSSLNVSPKNTIEFRLFRGTLKPETIKATLQLVDVLVEYAMDNGISTVAYASWRDIIKGAEKHAELTAYLQVKNLI